MADVERIAAALRRGCEGARGHLVHVKADDVLAILDERDGVESPPADLQGVPETTLETDAVKVRTQRDEPPEVKGQQQ